MASPQGSGTIADPSRYDWYVVGVLFAVSVLGYVDRVILSFLVESIKAELVLTDAQLGALTGLAFALLYVFGGIFLGRWIDRGHRPTILAVCILIWSLATAASGLAMGFVALFVARMFVGVGEAALNPAAVGIISSRFPQDRVQKPIGLFTTGLYVGGGLAIIAGGKLLAIFAAGGPYVLPFIGEAEPWRVIFVLLGLPGILMALLVQFTVLERRGRAVSAAAGDERSAAKAFAKANWRTIALVAVGVTSWSMNNYGLLNWYPAMLMRSYEMAPGLVAYTYGPAFLIGGVAGCLAVHPYYKWLRSRFADRAAFMLCASSMAVLSLATMAGPIMPNVPAAVAAAFLTLFISSMTVTSVLVLIVAVVPASSRGLYTGLYFALVNLTGGAFGSVVVGLLTDRVFGANGLNLSLSLMALLFGPLGAGMIYLASRAHRPAAA